MALSRFREAKTAEEEVNLVRNAVPIEQGTQGEHRNITVANFQLGSNFIRFEENVAKTFHGGLKAGFH